jgi:hypothetical protein
LGYCSCFAAALIFFGCESPQSASAEGLSAPAGAAGYQVPSALFKPVRLAQAGTISNSGNAAATGQPSGDPVEVPPATNAPVSTTPTSPPAAASANPVPRRAAASAASVPPASSAPWPVPSQKDQESFSNALSYAAQPSPMTTRTLQATPGKPHAAARGDTSVAVKHSDDRAPAAAPRSEGAVAAIPPKSAPKKPSSNSLVRVGDRFNDPWLRALILTPSTQDYMETTLMGTPDFRNLGAYLEKPAAAVALAFADDPHPGMTTDRFAGNPVTFVSTVPFGTTRAASR